MYASEGDLLHRFSSDGKDLNQPEWLLAAKDLGLKARGVSRKISRLPLLMLPALVWRDDGEYFILTRIDNAVLGIF